MIGRFLSFIVVFALAAPKPVHSVVINEFMADNNAALANSAGGVRGLGGALQPGQQ